MFRQLLAVLGNIPGLLLVTVGPLVGWLQGNLTHPDILISDLMNVPSYKAVVGATFCTITAVNIYLFLEAFRYTRARAPPELARCYDVLVSLLVFGAFPGMLLIVFFPFEEIGLYWFLHCLGAAIVFAAAFGVGLIDNVWVAPVLNKHDIVPKEDAWYRRVAGIAVCVLAVVAAALRPFHFADPHTWSPVMLALEVVFCCVGMLGTVFCNWRTLGEMDRVDPVAFAASPACEKGRTNPVASAASPASKKES